MNEEMLKLYAHPFIQARRGLWQVGDRGYYVKGECNVIIVGYSSLKKISTFRTFDGVRKIIPLGDLIWLPPVYDDERPERSLIGMVKDFYALRKWTINKERWSCEHFIGNGVVSVESLALTEAILRAIRGQEGEPR